MKKVEGFRLLLVLLFLPSLLTAQTWSAFTPQPTTSVLWDAFALNATTAWAVGNSGTVLRWDGTSWNAESIGTASQRFGVWASAANDVYVVGINTGNQLHHYDGTTWTNLLSGTNWWGTGSIRSVWGTSSSNVWISGTTGRIYNWNGSSWTLKNSGISATFSGTRIWGTDASNLWTVGTTGGTNTGIIYRWDEGTTTWVSELSGVPRVAAIWGTSSTDMWAVGGTGSSNPGQIYHWDGTTWSDVTPEVMPTLNHIYGSNGSNIWAAGNSGGLYYYNGTSWSTQASARTTQINAIAIGKTGSANRLWTVGDVAGSTNPVFTATATIASLPITLESFNYSNTGNGLRLDWTTSAEQNSHSFEIEHLQENGDWTTLATLPAAYNSSVQKKYSYTHANPPVGKNYYRLRQVDADGKSSYSRVLYAFITGNLQGLSLLANPVSNGRLQLSAGKAQEIILCDLQGRTLARKSLVAGVNTIDVSTLPAGTYLVKTASDTIKFLVR